MIDTETKNEIDRLWNEIYNLQSELRKLKNKDYKKINSYDLSAIKKISENNINENRNKMRKQKLRKIRKY